MTNQEIFDKVSTHLLTQGAKSMLDDPTKPMTCAYRGTEGRRCAVGVLISDEVYYTEIEGDAVTYDGVKAMLRASGVSSVNGRRLDLLSDLQQIHDTCPPLSWGDELLLTARKYRLNAEAIRRGEA